MRCPYCQSEDTQVKDSRPAEDGAAIRRRRICPDCGGRFTTFERIEEVPLWVVKRSGLREPFDRAKVVEGVRAACKNRPVTDEQMDELAHDAIDGALDPVGIDIALPERDGEGAHQFFAVERHLSARPLDGHQIAKLDALECGEAAAAIGADAPAADRRPILGGTRILHLRIFGLAIGTAHGLIRIR